MNPKMILIALVGLIACGKPAESNQPAATEVVRFSNEDAVLEGTLEIPASTSKVPLIVFVHGSGQRTREDYFYLTPDLLNAGYAVFRYDKRGAGASGGNFIEVGTYNGDTRIPLLASDAAAAVKTLSRHSGIDADRIILMGGSQAGWIIPVVTTLADVYAAVCVSGPTVSVGEEIFYSDMAEHGTTSQTDADGRLKDFRGPHSFDNITYVSGMKQPSFWIFGGKDISIPVKECIARLDSVKKASGMPIEMKIYPDADHGIYNQSTQQFEPYLPVVIAWLRSLD